MANVIQFTVKSKDQSSKAFGGIAKSIGLIGAAIGGLAAVKGVGSTVIGFEKLRLSINTVSASAADAKKNMRFIEDFAARTPFDLNQVTDSFIKMKALGLDPSEEALTSYGDTASAMGKSLNQMIEAVADASVGEFERLKEFGIKARNEGDTIKFTFQGVTTSVANNSQAIEEHLQSIGRTNFAGAMATQANSVVGAVSNMQDSFVRLGVALGDAGIRPLIRAAAQGITKMVQTIIDNKDTIRAIITNIVSFGLVLKQVFVTIVGGIRTLLESDLKTALTSIFNTLSNIGQMIIDWAAAVIPAVAKIFLKGFPIMLGGLVSIFVNTFTDIGKLIGNIIVLALVSLLTVFKEFGAAINDVIQNAILGIDDGGSFGEILAERFAGAFQNSIDQMKVIADDGKEIGAKVVDGIVETVEQLKDQVGPIIQESVGEIVTASSEAGGALADLFGINMDLINEQAAAMTEGLSAFQDKVDEQNEVSAETSITLLESIRGAWQTFIDDQGGFVAAFSARVVATAKAVSKSVGKAFADTVVSGKSLMKGLEAIGKQVLASLIASLVELGVQRLILSVINKGAVASDAAAEAAANAAGTFGGQMKAMSSAPFPVNLTAPVVAAAMTGVTLSGMASSAAAGAAVGAGFGGVAHGGLDFVPAESTFLLNRGERVLSPRQNTDLTDFLDGQGGGPGGGGITIESIHILENATGEAFAGMTPEEIKDEVADKIITALDALDNEGVRPAFIDRGQNQ
jgi:hypothetical protein